MLYVSAYNIRVRDKFTKLDGLPSFLPLRPNAFPQFWFNICASELWLNPLKQQAGYLYWVLLILII